MYSAGYLGLDCRYATTKRESPLEDSRYKLYSLDYVVTIEQVPEVSPPLICFAVAEL